MWNFNALKKDDVLNRNFGVSSETTKINGGSNIVRGYRVNYKKFSKQYDAVSWVTFIYDEITEPEYGTCKLEPEERIIGVIYRKHNDKNCLIDLDFLIARLK